MPKTLKERILEGIASLRQATPQMSAEDHAELARVEAAVHDEITQTVSTDADKDKQPAATVAAQPSHDVQALMATVQAQSVQIAAMQTEQTAQKASTQLAKDNARVDALVRGKQMTPAEASGWKQLAQTNAGAFEAAFATQESRPVLSVFGGNTTRARTEMSGDPGAELSRLTEARAKEKNIGYGDAAKQIAAERPDLAQAHSAQTQVVSVEGND